MSHQIRLRMIFIYIGVLNFLLAIVPTFWLRSLLFQFMGAVIDRSVILHRGVRIFARGRLCIGEGTVINNNCYLDNRAGIYIGDNVSIAHSVRIYTMGHDINSPSFFTAGKSVQIEDYVVIFSNVLIMPGVTIGAGAVVYAGSVVSRNVPPLGVVAGNPAKVIKFRSENALKYKLKYDYWLAP